MAGLAFGLAGVSCTLDDPDTPELAGPSTVGRSIELRAVPDQLVSDGFSSSVLEAVLRGPNSERISGATVYFDIEGFVDRGNLAPLNGARPTFGGVEATQVTAVTDGDGVARVRYWAPFRTDQPDDFVVTILAREAGTNFRRIFDVFAQTDIFLRAADRPFPSPFPTPSPGCEESEANLALSGLCPGGEIRVNSTIRALGFESDPGDGEVITAYIWNWGDGTQERTNGPEASHVYSPSLAGSSVSVSLSVINSCGHSSSVIEADIAVVSTCP